MNEETVAITKADLRLAILHGWSDCIPSSHMSLDAAWDWLVNPDDPSECDHRAGDQYDFDGFACWPEEDA